jgi:uncharacterized protein
MALQTIFSRAIFSRDAETLFLSCRTMIRVLAIVWCVAAPNLFAGPASPISQNSLLAASAIAQTKITTIYDPAYVRLDYPGGDVPAERGVCADVIVRAFRYAGVDLQKLLHEDMLAHFAAYPKRWGLRKPDRNIDHRRVPNLLTFFARQGKTLAITNDSDDYLAGDVVVWDLGGGLVHTGIVSADKTLLLGHPLVVHNIGGGAQLEDVLFAWKIIGHVRYFDR